MASHTEIFEHFLSPMKRVFQRPLHAAEQDETAALSEYADALKPYSAEILAEAWKDVRNTQAARSWPPVAVCIKACAAARKVERAEARAKHPDAVSGRMVDGQWQPWVGCQCQRCKANEAYRKLEDVARWGTDSAWYTPEREQEAKARGIPGLPPHPGAQQRRELPSFAMAEKPYVKRALTEAEKHELAARESSLAAERLQLLADKLPQARMERQ